MDVRLLNESGLEEALYGLSLSFKDRDIARGEWWSEERKDKTLDVARRLAFRQGGHNKFLESLQVWLDVEAPRYWWSEMDTYRVGTTKQSESTMHTLKKRPLKASDFYRGRITESMLEYLNSLRQVHPVDVLKSYLPESYLQRRVVCTNYKVLQNIHYQRHNHRLPEWKIWCDVVLDSVSCPEFICKGEENDAV